MKNKVNKINGNQEKVLVAFLLLPQNTLPLRKVIHKGLRGSFLWIFITNKI
jgi:hypothetical protein